MRFISLVFLLILFVSCKNGSVKIENIFDKKDSVSKDLNRNEEPKNSRLSEKKRIKTSEASINIGAEVILTGYVADVNIRNKVAYLNFDNKYPEHTFTGVIFAGDYGKFSDLNDFKGKTVELTGIVTEYNGKPQIIINSPGQIKIIK